MSATPTPSTQGTQAPSQIELLWDRYRSLAYVIVLAVLGALGINYAVKYFNQKKTDEAWTKVAATLGLDKSYTDQAKAHHSATERLADVDAGALRQATTEAPDAVRPYLYLALAQKCILTKDWDGAEAALKELEAKYPNHTVVKSTAVPVQAPKLKKEDEDAAKPTKPKRRETEPLVPGSSVSQLRKQIEGAKAFSVPAQFAKTEVPADAPKVKVELSGSYGSFVIALMGKQAPKHVESFLALAQAETPIWVGMAVDEIHRPTKTNPQPHELHLGFESTKDDDRTKWTDKDPSKTPLEFETNQLSHFAGAVAGRNEADGKSCADRFWITVDDAPRFDGERVIFGYVVEGLDNLKKVCEATMTTAQEEDQGRGKPSDNIRVTKVTVVR